ncbi:hypothetical protein GCM10022246_39000 [Pedobacter ginsengiterrae]|uniref:HTH cro/C1-type domain-containing protein n=1 Tax=Pedobacter ginsengiterrae TaxID=871696 RepID=A0ABP7QIW4_9SPHI
MGKEAHYKLITERIRLRRIELEFSQEYMAEQLDISQNTYLEMKGISEMFP